MWVRRFRTLCAVPGWAQSPWLASNETSSFAAQAADEPSPADIGNLELPVSQLQQTNAQKKASDKLADKQKAFTKEQQQIQRRCYRPIRMTSCASSEPSSKRSRSDTVDQLDKTRRQLADTKKQLAKLKANPPQPASAQSLCSARSRDTDQLARNWQPSSGPSRSPSCPLR